MSLLTKWQAKIPVIDEAKWWTDRILQHKSEYTELEYIQSTGNQFIDTGYIPRSYYTRYEVGFMRTGTNGNWNPIINNEEDVRFGIVCTTSSTSQGSCWAGPPNSGYQSLTFPMSNNIKYDMVLDKTGIMVNNTKYTFSSTASSATGSWTAMVNHRHSSASGYSSEYSLGRWYYLRIYDNDVLQRDFIPARDRNNVVCFYDKVSKTYFYNAGSGSFTAGPEID